MNILPDTLTGEKLYATYCAALWVDWPRVSSLGAYVQTYGAQTPAKPTAWPFLHKVEQDGWNNLADVLAGRVSE